MTVPHDQGSIDSYLSELMPDAHPGIESWKQIPGGVRAEIDVESVERDYRSLFLATGEVKSISCGHDESNEHFATFADLVDEEEGHAVFFTGWQSLGDFSDDENDARLYGTLYIVDPAYAEATRSIADREFRELLTKNVVEKLDEIAGLLKDVGDDALTPLIESKSMRYVMRRLAFAA